MAITNKSIGGIVDALNGENADIAASTSAKGIVELATAAETLALTDTAKVVTPAGLGGVIANMALMNAYGTRWDTTASSPVLTKGIVAAGVFIPFDYTGFPIQEQMRRCVLNSIKELQYFTGADDSTKKADGTAANIDGTDGQVHVQVPKFEYLQTVDGNYRYDLVGTGTFYLTKSDTSVVFSSIHPWFWEGGSLADHKYIGAFEGVLYDDTSSAYVDGTGSSLYASGDKIHSISGYIPMTYISRPELRAGCTVDAAFHQQGYWSDHAILLLYITEFATWNSQIAIPGYTEGTPWDLAKRCKTGITATLGNQSGSVTYGDADVSLRCSYDWSGTPTIVVANSFRGIENFYGHIWKWVDGVKFEFVGDPLSAANIYVSNNPADWDDDENSTDYTDLGVDLPLASGYQSALHPGTFLPSSVSGGGSDTYITDYYYVGSAGWRALVSGGHLYDGGRAGVARRNADNAGSSDRTESLGGRPAA